MPTTRIRQYFGPSPRHSQACVALEIERDSRLYRPAAVANAMQAAGVALATDVDDAAMSLAEATGQVARAMLSIPESCAVSHGSDDELDWTCLSFPYPGVAAAALNNACRALLLCHADTPPQPEALRRLAVKPPAMRKASVTMTSIAAECRFDVALVSRYAGVFQLGQGKAGKLFHGTSNEADSYAGQLITADKRATTEVLSRAGLPTTRQVSVGSPDAAMKAVQRIGFPCVIKPSHGALGQGVTTRIMTPEQAKRAIEFIANARAFPLIVENHIEGDDHRITIADGRILWAYSKTAAHVIGDGRSSLAALVEQENTIRAQASATERAFVKPLAMDADRERYVRERYAIGFSDVPEAGQRIDLAGQANVAQGGKLDDVSARIHPDNRKAFLEIARLLRVGMIGIDFMSADISRPWHENGAAVIEVNCTPGIGGLRDGCLIQRAAFPHRLSGRVPAIVVIGNAEWRETVARIAGEALAREGFAPATAEYAIADEAARDGRIVATAGWPPIETALIDIRTQALVVAASPETIADHGFPLQACDAVLAADGNALPGHRADAWHAVGSADGARIEALVHDICAPYRDGSGGGPLPHIETVTGQGEDEDALTLRVWRPQAVARARFWQDWPGRPDNGETAVSPPDMLAACRALANRELAAQGAALLDAEFEWLDDDHAFGPPALRVRTALPAGSTQRSALVKAIDAVNARMGDQVAGSGVPGE